MLCAGGAKCAVECVAAFSSNHHIFMSAITSSKFLDLIDLHKIRRQRAGGGGFASQLVPVSVQLARV